MLTALMGSNNRELWGPKGRSVFGTLQAWPCGKSALLTAAKVFCRSTQPCDSQGLSTGNRHLDFSCRPSLWALYTEWTWQGVPWSPGNWKLDALGFNVCREQDSSLLLGGSSRWSGFRRRLAGLATLTLSLAWIFVQQRTPVLSLLQTPIYWFPAEGLPLTVCCLNPSGP